MLTEGPFDRDVGRVAGAIYSDLSTAFPQPPLMLVPTLTFKVRRVLEGAGGLARLTKAQRVRAAEDIVVSIVPLLHSLDIEPDVVARMTPIIETAALKAMLRGRQREDA